MIFKKNSFFGQISSHHQLEEKQAVKIAPTSESSQRLTKA